MNGLQKLSLGLKRNNSMKNMLYCFYERYYCNTNKFKFSENQNDPQKNKTNDKKQLLKDVGYTFSKSNNTQVNESPDLFSMADNSDGVIKKSAPNKNSDDFKLQRHATLNQNSRPTGEIIFGIHPVLIALQENRRIFKRLYLKRANNKLKNTVPNYKMEEIEELANEKNVQIHHVSKETLDKLANRLVHQGVCADVNYIKTKRYEKHSSSNLFKQPTSPCIWLVLVNIQDPMNMGAILRTSYFLGVDQIFCSFKNSCALSPVVSKASSGALEIMDIWSLDNFEEFLQEQKTKGWHIVGTGNCNFDADKPTLMNVADFDLKQPTIVVLGNEGFGLAKSTMEICETILTIKPRLKINPFVDSLNVSVAAGIILQALCSKKVDGK